MKSLLLRVAVTAGFAILFGHPAWAITVDNAMMTTDNAADCATPTPTSIVSQDDAQVELWFTVTDQHVGDMATVTWYDPSGQERKSGSKTIASDGLDCYNSVLPIAGQSRQLGPWVVKIIWNNIIARTVTFTVGQVPLRGDLSVKWVSAPPANLAAGQQFNISFDIEGDTAVSYRIHSGGNPDPSTYPTTQSSWIDTQAGVHTAQLQAPNATSATTYYYVVHAYISKIDYFSIVAKTTISPASSGGGGPSRIITWAPGMPPQTFQQGQTMTLSWNISGAVGAVYSHVHASLNKDGLKDPNQAVAKNPPVGGSDGTWSQDVTPGNVWDLSPGTPVYFLIHAYNDEGSINYWTDDADIGKSIVSAATQQNTATWTYTAKLNGYLDGVIVVLQREQTGSSTYQYRWYIVADSNHLPHWGLDAAALTILYKNDPSILAKRSSALAQVIYDTILAPSSSELLQNLNQARWQTPFHALLGAGQLDEAQTVLDIIPWGDAIPGYDVVSAVASIAKLLFPDPSIEQVHSSSTFQQLMLQDTYNTISLAVDNQQLNISAIKFAIDVDERSGEIPYFMLRFAQSGAGALIGGGIVGLEVRDDKDIPIVSRWP